VNINVLVFRDCSLTFHSTFSLSFFYVLHRFVTYMSTAPRTSDWARRLASAAESDETDS
jgi:hypothetical protein